ncbi:hypothetical protein Scep_021153 [Stephania cephalantha]|uniref:Uncharacterized protein n=1 Tax=Stephania cephalantha TaxID=152367 RepID=A0AAP0I1N1_9MAGN
MDGQPSDTTQLEVEDTSDSTRPTLTLESLAQTMDDRFTLLIDMMRAREARETTSAPTIVMVAPMTIT